MIIDKLQALPTAFFKPSSHSTCLTTIIGRQFGPRAARVSGGLRGSSLGKPAVLQALDKLGYEDRPIDFRTRCIFLTGDLFEASLVELIGAANRHQPGLIPFWGAQDEIDFFGVKGHPDGFTVDESGRSVVLDFKTASPGFSAQVAANPATWEQRGYLTQLSVYAHASNVDQCMILAMDKGTGNLSEYVFDKDVALVERAQRIISKMDKVKTPEDILTAGRFRAPDPVPQIKGGKPTGACYVPMTMRYSPYVYAFYQTVEDVYNRKTVTYVTDVYETVTDASLKASMARYQELWRENE